MTYLVGGCVRDILLGRTPKDFDIGTLATPNQVRRLFRNSRVIGRRFRLVHVVFGSKILEVATFRGGTEDGTDPDAEPGDRLIVRANNFGTPEEDAVSRDFTINGLFYDPVKGQVIDFVSGHEDLEARLIRTVGRPSVRFEEDPVRILRAVKFSARLGFSIESETWEAMGDVADEIRRCPVPRVTEELYRLAESGHCAAAVSIMAKSGVLPTVLPEVAAYHAAQPEAYERYLEFFDRVIRAHRGCSREFVLSGLYYPLALEQVELAGIETGPGWAKVVEAWFEPIGIRMHLPVKHRIRFRSLVEFMGRVLGEPGQRRRNRLSVPQQRLLPQALTLMRLHHRVHGGLAAAYEYWRTLASAHDVTWVPVSQPRFADAEPPPERDRRSGRRRRRRRSRAPSQDG